MYLDIQINIPDSELELLNLKLKHTRLPSLGQARWSEASSENVNLPLLKDILSYWQTDYSWSDEQERLNRLSHFVAAIEVKGFGTIKTHFVHGKAHLPFLHECCECSRSRMASISVHSNVQLLSIVASEPMIIRVGD